MTQIKKYSDLVSVLLVRAKWQSILFILAFMLALIHFGLPLVITYDTGHYHTYLAILSGNEPLNNWDRVRQPGYPLFLWIIRKFLGGSQQSFLLIHYVFLVIVFGFILSFVWQRTLRALPRGLCIFLIGFLFIFEPLVIGFFHVLLTECVAATIAVVSCFMAVNWVACSQNKHSERKHYLFQFLIWTFLIIFSYHLKQSYVFCALIPFFVATALSFFGNKGRSLKLFQVTAVFGSLVLLIVSIFAWNNFLPENTDTYMKTREATSIGAKLLVAGLSRAENLGPISNFQKNRGLTDGKPELEKAINRALGEIAIRPDCTLLYRLGNFPNTKYLILPCKGSALSSGDAIYFVIQAFALAPSEALLGYGEGLLRLVRILPSGVALGGGKYDIMKETESIGLMTFRSSTNIYWMPPNLSKLVEGYRQNDPDSSRGFFGKIPFKFFQGQTLILFTAVLIMSLLTFPFVFWLLIKSIIQSKRLNSTVVFLAATAATNASLLGFHIALGMVIDRYAFPAYFLGLVALCLCLVTVLDAKLANKNVLIQPD